MLLQSTFVASLLLAVAASPLERGIFTILESLAQIPAGFVKTGTPPATQDLPLRLALKQNNIPGLEATLSQVSDPSSALYGQYLSADEVAEFVKPTEETFAAVSQWLSTNGITSKAVTPAGDILEITMPVAKANQLLATDFFIAKHTDSGETSIRTLQYSIPASLKDHIQFIHPTISFTPPPMSGPKVVAPMAAADNTTANASCDDQVTPACLQALYGIPSTKATQAANVIGVPGFVNQYANRADLRTFLENLRHDNTQASFTEVFLDGGKNDQTAGSAGAEANLDIQYTVGLATGVPVSFISVGQSNINGFIDLNTYILNQPKPPTVVSLSYGFNENQLSPAVQNTVCNQYMQLGARGVSVIVASGDGGVGGSRPSNTCTRFVPTFPASCPYITSVGATRKTKEQGADLSAGGFSETFARPQYQNAAVATYLGLNIIQDILEAGRFNTNGRGYPDVAAQGENIVIELNGETVLVDGTSASAPIFASIISLINDRRLAAGKSALGFLNPALYSVGKPGLNDITSGHNPSCRTNGFTASAGWDPVTGLGTPNFAKLNEIFGN
ncbi:family S53 protease [Mycena capillaripes]|nr:family S53 protease [Mycena capillaripes]